MSVELDFDHDGLRLAGTLTLPDGPGPHPAVVGASGFGGVKEMLLPRYADALAAVGVGCLIFDYAGFGASAGERRQHVAPRSQATQYGSALDALARDSRIDAARLGAWGPSMAGAHALVCGARDQRVRAVVSLIPFTGAPARPEPHLVAAGAGAVARRLLRRPDALIPAAGLPGARAIMRTDGAADWIARVSADAPSFRNEVTTASLLEVARYSAARAARTIAVPTRVILAEADALTPAAKVRRAVAGNPHVDVVSFPDTHFELFEEHGDEAVAATVDWFARHLNG